MKKVLKSFLLTLTLACAITIHAQKSEAYTDGESLIYEAKYSKAILRGIAAADLNFTVERTKDDNFLIKSEARSKGTLVKLFAKFYQNLQSTVDGKTFAIKRTVKRDEQGERVRESEALFDYKAKKVIYIETDPKDVARPPRQVASPISTDTQDLISGLYTIRRTPLTVGKSFTLSISDSGLVYKIPVKGTAREQQKTIFGRVFCFRVEPEIFGENRLIDGKGSMILWITDDVRRLPVRAQVNANIGRVEIKLKKSESKNKGKNEM